MSSKIFHLLPLLWQQPKEFAARLVAIADSQFDRYLHPPFTYHSTALGQAIDRVDKILGWRLSEFMAEPECQAIMRQVQQSILNLPANAPFCHAHNSDFSLAQTCYAFCRMLKPL